MEFQKAQRDEHPSVTDNEFGRAYGKIIKDANTGKYTVFIDVSLAAFIMEDVLFDSCFKNVDGPNYSARLRRLQEEEKRRKEHEEYLRKERIKALYNNEVDKTNALLNKSADFEIACKIRRYIDAIKNDPSNPDNNPDWIDWASKKADWIDPTVAREDEFFGKRKHGVDADQKELKRRW